MRKVILAALIVIFASPAIADDQQLPQPPSDVAGFMAWCTQNADTCSDIIKHHQDLSLVMSTLGAPRKFCVPPETSAEERRVAVLNWLDQNVRDKSAQIGDRLEIAEQSIWPCHR